MAELWHTLQKILQHNPTARRQLAIGLLAAVLERLLALLPWGLIALAAQALLTGTLTHSPLQLAVLMGTLLLARIIIAQQGQLRCFLGAYDAIASYRHRLLARLNRLAPGQLQHQRTGTLTDILTDDMRRFEDIVSHLLPELAAALLVPLGLGVALLWLNPLLTLAWLLPLPCALLALFSLRRSLQHQGATKQAQQQQCASLLLEFLNGIVTLRIFNRSGSWQQRLAKHFTQLRNASLGWKPGVAAAFSFIA